MDRITPLMVLPVLEYGLWGRRKLFCSLPLKWSHENTNTPLQSSKFLLNPIVYCLFSTDFFSLQPLEIVRSPSLPFCAKEQHAHWSHTYIIPKCYQCAALEICSCSSSRAIHVHNYSVLGACRYNCQTYLGSIVTTSFVQYWLNLRRSFLCECWACSLWLSLTAWLGSMILDVCPNINYSMTNRIITSREIGTLYILPTLELFTQPKSFSECKYFLWQSSETNKETRKKA